MASPESLPTGTVTFLFTDIEGSTRLLQRLGPDYARALGEHQALLRAAFAAYGGAEVDTQGDAFFVAFASAPAAVAAAADATRALAAHEWPAETTLRVRMGLHTGTPQLVGDHYVGLDVHRAARIASAGHGGQILLSETTRALTEQDLPAGVSLRDLGSHRLKDLQRAEHITQLVLESLPDTFPPLKTLDRRQHNLPLQPGPLLGREEPLVALTTLLRRDDTRLVTLTGPGGTGKTRLAIQVAAELIYDFSDGVWFVRLSRLSDPALVLPTIAQTLELKESGSQSLVELLRAYIADKCLLLVLDNFEQVVGAANEIADLLASAPGIKALVTSRVRLRVRFEHEYPVAPLPLPELARLAAPEHLSEYAAVALFLERAREVRPSFAVTAANAPAIAEICARLDGLPLAIELAAARVKLLPPEALLGRLASRLTLLTGGARDLEERQQTMRATISWSDGLLTPAERLLFRRLAVFVGGCSLEEAEAICVAPSGAEPLTSDLFDELAALVDHSLAQQSEEGDEPRFSMLQLIREYALEQLEASGEAEALRRAHASYFLALAEQATKQRYGPDSNAWRERLERDQDNLRAALAWARDHDEVELGLRLVVALTWFWKRRGRLREGRTWIEEMLTLRGRVAETAQESDEVTKARAKALLNDGMFASEQGSLAVAQRQIEEARALALAIGDARTARQALTNLGLIASLEGDLARATTLYTESLTLARELEDQQGIGTLLTNLGNLSSSQGDLEQALALFTESLTLAREWGNRDLVALNLNNLGVAARKRGDIAQAQALLGEALSLYWQAGDPRRCAMTLESLAETASTAGQVERAARLLGAAIAQRDEISAPLTARLQAELEQLVAPARATLGAAAWEAAFAAGRALTLEQAVVEALGATDEQSASS